MTRTTPPVLFFAFANDRADAARYLRDLPAELRVVRRRLERAEQGGVCEVVIRANATIAEVLDVFQDPRWQGRIAVFHFAGHAGGFGLLLETAAGAPALAHAAGLADFLGSRPGLDLVFLNGCSTEPQVEGLLSAGVPAVVATAEAVDDAIAVELCDRFYAGLAAGSSIDDAFRQAVAAIAITHATPESCVRPGATLDGWPWRLHVRAGPDTVRAWSLPRAAGSPLWGLPPLDSVDLPDSPFRSLRRFSEQDAEVFFGRDREIRALYDRITAPSDAPILLFCGQSGVGKSSLLRAGLIPYLQQVHEVAFARRRRETGLAGTLRRAIGATDDGPLRDAWRDREAAIGRPLTVLLDQVEEAYTQPGSHDEIDHLVDTLTGLFEAPAERPRGRLVLSFRKEWLAELDERLRVAGLPRSRFFLDRLDRAGIVAAIEGPTRSERLRRQYGLSVEAGLAGIIADDLLADPGAPVAPTLAVLLAKMWRQARARDPAAPTFDGDLYADHRTTLLAFVDEQIAALRAWNGDVVDSGLALDVLAFHTTPLGTADHRTAAELASVYAHRADLLGALVGRAAALNLLTETPSADGGAGGTRLTHDTLAPLVRLRFDESDRPGQRARRVLENRASAAPAVPMDEADLSIVEVGARGMRAWRPAERSLVEASRDRARRARRVRHGLRAAAVAAVLLVAALAIAARVQERAARRMAREANSRAIAAAASAEPQTDVAALLALEAVRLDPTYEARDALHAVLTRPFPRLARAIQAHDAEVQAVAYSPDGTTAATGSRDGTVRLWNVETREPHGDPIDAHEFGVVDLAFHPSGRRLATVGSVGTLRLWDLATGRAIGDPMVDHPNGVNAVAYSPDGSLVASAGNDSLVVVRDADTGEVVRQLRTDHANGVMSLAYSPDGRRLITGSRDGTLAAWDMTTGRLSASVEAGFSDIMGLAYSPDARVIASTAIDGWLRFWEAPALRPLGGPVAGHVGPSGQRRPIRDVAFSPDGALLVTSGQDGTLRLWDVETRTAAGPPMETIVAWLGPVAFRADGQQLLSGASDGQVRLWDLEAAVPLATTLAVDGGRSRSVAWSPDGAHLATAGLGAVQLWSAATLEPLGPIPGHDSWVRAVEFSADGSLLATASEDGTIQVREASTGRPVHALVAPDSAIVEDVSRPAHRGSPVFALAFHPGDLRMVSGGGDLEVRQWDAAAGRHLGALSGHTSPPYAVAFSPDGERVVSAGLDRTVRVWAVATGAEIVVHRTGLHGVRAVAFRPDGSVLATGGTDGRIWIRNGETGDVVGDPIVAHPDDVSSLAFSPDGALLASAGFDGTIRLWDVETRRPFGRPLEAHADEVWDIAFHPDGSRLASAGDDGVVRVWSLDLRGIVCASSGGWLPLSVWQRMMGAEPWRRTCPADGT